MSFTFACLSLSVFAAALVLYAAIEALLSAVVIRSTNSCSGAKTINVTPKIVSGRVVKTSILPSLPSIEN